MRFQTAGCVASGDTIHDDDIQLGARPPHLTPPHPVSGGGAGLETLCQPKASVGGWSSLFRQTFTERCRLDSSVLKAVLNMSGESGVPCLPKETENEDELRNICADAQNGEALDVLGEGMFADFLPLTPFPAPP